MFVRNLILFFFYFTIFIVEYFIIIPKTYRVTSRGSPLVYSHLGAGPRFLTEIIENKIDTDIPFSISIVLLFKQQNYLPTKLIVQTFEVEIEYTLSK